MNEYRVPYNEQYVLSSVERYRRQRRVYPWFIFAKAVCGFGLALLILIVAYGALASPSKSGPLFFVAIVPGVFLVLLFLGPRIDYFVLKRRLRKSPFYGEELKIVLSQDGVIVDTAKSQTSLKWSAYSRARRLATGFLIFTEPTVFQWLPDSALAQGSLTDVTDLLRRSIPAYENA